MKTLLLLALLLTAHSYAFAQTAAKAGDKQPPSTEQELIGLNQELITALEHGDKSVAERIYADDFVRTSTQGEVLTKAQVLASMKAPDAGSKVSYESLNIQVFDYGSAAVLVYLSIRHTENKDGKSDFYYRVTDTFVRREGRWLKAASAGTPVAQAAKPK